MQLDVLRRTRPGKTVPKAILTHMVVVAGHQVPSDVWELPHRLNRLRKSLHRKLLLIVKVASQQHGRGLVFHRKLSERAYGGIPRILKEGGNFGFEIPKYLADLQIGGVNQSHAWSLPHIHRYQGHRVIAEDVDDLHGYGVSARLVIGVDGGL